MTATIPKPGLPAELVHERPEVATTGVGAYIVEAAVAGC